MRGGAVVVLASGDPFWFGAGGSLMAHLAAGEWVSHPAPSTFPAGGEPAGLAAGGVRCLGLHAAPFARLRPVLGRGVRAICTLRDGAAVGELAAWLAANGHPGARLVVLERLGGPLERITEGMVPTT
jgi:precorrin-6B C5,15-methyltransferase / cobalt-precorrin-6B C5,C15-methyltransferase